jgi:hypothetical protein
VAWYIIPDAWTFDVGGQRVTGAWYPSTNSIVLAAQAGEFGDLVRHEMLHALLGRAETGTHPRAQFVGRCGGIVTCDDRCIADGGAPLPPSADALAVRPEDLEAAVTVAPQAPSSAMWDGYFMMIVTARNPSNSPVIVQLPSSGDAGPPVSFSYEIEGSGYSTNYNIRANVPEVTRFAAGEAKQFIFDFRIGPTGTRYRLPPGTYRFKGAYSDVWAPDPATVTVRP